MIRLLVVLLAALYSILWVFGDEARRPEVARSEPLGLGLLKAAYIPQDVTITTSLPPSDISDYEAVLIALEAGVKARSERKSQPFLGGAKLVAVVSAETAVTQETPATFWYVTGTRVNLRSGPGTSNGVVGSLTLGTEAEILDDQSGWYQIRTADGSVSGWIFSKFLAERLPG